MVSLVSVEVHETESMAMGKPVPCPNLALDTALAPGAGRRREEARGEEDMYIAEMKSPQNNG